MTNTTQPDEQHNTVDRFSSSGDLTPSHAPAGITRRSLLSWLGSATVYALSSDLLTGCGGQASKPNPSATRTSPGTSAGTSPDPSPSTPPGATTDASQSPRSFLFTPSPVEGAIYDRWWGNTVDPQDQAQIIASWRLKIGGLVEKPVTLSFADLLALPRQDQSTDFHCVEGWSVLDVPWNGVHIDDIIALVRPLPTATNITFRSFGNIYVESLSLEVMQESRTLLAYGIGGSSLPLTHGFPLRVVVPRFHGYKGAKWVTELEFTDTVVDGYWEQRGYPTDAPVAAFRLREGKY